MTQPTPHRAVARRRRFGLRPAYLVLLIVMGLFTYKFVEKTREVRRLTTQAAALQYQNDKTAAENRRIQQSIKYYQTITYVEGRARASLGYIKPGDVAVQIQPQYRQSVVRAAPAQPQPTPLPVWRQWWRTFFN